MHDFLVNPPEVEKSEFGWAAGIILKKYISKMLSVLNPLIVEGV